MRRAFQRQGEYFGRKWRQLHLVEDGAITTLELEPAAWDGWRVVKMARTTEDFPNMSVDDIATWILTNWARGAEVREIVPNHVDEVVARYQERLKNAEG